MNSFQYLIHWLVTELRRLEKYVQEFIRIVNSIFVPQSIIQNKYIMYGMVYIQK